MGNTCCCCHQETKEVDIRELRQKSSNKAGDIQIESETQLDLPLNSTKLEPDRNSECQLLSASAEKVARVSVFSRKSQGQAGKKSLPVGKASLRSRVSDALMTEYMSARS